MPPAKIPKFVLTRELGKLATWLRIFGYDTFLERAGKSSTAVILALKQGRVIVTRSRTIGRSASMRVVRLASEDVQGQLKELLNQLRLTPHKDIILTRCTVCNVLLEDARKESVKEKVPTEVYSANERFLSCPQCARVYWRGTHWENVQKFLKEFEAA